MTEHDISSMAGRLRLVREKRNLSPTELAGSIGVRPDTVRKWESGLRVPRANRLATLAGVLSVPIAWLLSGDGPMEGGTRDDPRKAAIRSALADLKELQRKTERGAKKPKMVEEKLLRISDSGSDLED